MAEVFHGDLWGTRDSKYDALRVSTLGKPLTSKIDNPAPHYPFVPRDHSLTEKYRLGFGLTQMMTENVTGIVTMGDGFALAETASQLEDRLDDLLCNEHTEESLKKRYSLGKNYAGWLISNKPQLKEVDLQPVPITYRPFDNRVTYFDNRILWRWREKVMRNLLAGDNIALIFSRQAVRADAPPVNVFLSTDIFDNRGVYSNKGISQAAPLYIYPTEQDLDKTRRVNFERKLYKKLQKMADHHDHGKPDEVQVFDYIYGVLHCPAYRETYADFLKIDFPRIPWPTTAEEFWDVSAKGTELRKLHLMEPAVIGITPYPFTGEGDNEVGKPRFEDGCIWINDNQFFADAPPVSWDFYIGGYQPAQKWLKDRKGRALSFEDVKHYQRILKILSETDRIMHTIKMSLE